MKAQVNAKEIVNMIIEDNSPIDRAWVRNLNRFYKTESEKRGWANEMVWMYAPKAAPQTRGRTTTILINELFN